MNNELENDQFENDECEYEYEPDIYSALFNYTEEPPADLLEQWRKEDEERALKEAKHTSEYLVCLITEEDGSEYFYFRDVCIEVTEHFCDTGKPLDELMQNVIQYAAKESVEG